MDKERELLLRIRGHLHAQWRAEIDAVLASPSAYNEEQQAMVENATLAKVATKKVGDETMGDAAEAFVRDLVTRGKFDASTDNPVGYDYLWLGCALRDAFYAGVRWAETRPTSDER